MEKKIFHSIFMVSFSVLIANTCVYLYMLYSYCNDIKALRNLLREPIDLMMVIIRPIFVITIFLLIIATVVASKVAKKIVDPINDIDVDNPKENDVYDELSPLLGKISKQSRQLQRQIKEATKKQIEFVTITENMNEGILVIDTKYEVLSYNKAIVDMLVDGDIPKTKSVFAFNRSNKFRKIIKKALEGKSKERIIEIKEKNYEIMASPVRENDRIIGAVIIVMDVTERIQRENYRREFTANVSHELKTPLTSISGFAEIMKDSIARPEDMPELAKSIYEEAQRLIVLVNDIIKLSALEDEKIAYDSIDINMANMLEEIEDRLYTSIQKKNIVFKIKVKDIMIKAPKEIVSEMLFNLCDNAIKYNKKNGEVIVSLEENKKNCIIKVKDTGIGIESEDYDRIFERFYRVDKSHSKEVGGTGLGLSIVKHDVNYLDGNISVDSNIGVGTEITVSIPKKR